MTYLLMLGWPWCAGALALGALVGSLTSARARGAALSGDWIASLSAVALATGYSTAFADVLEGREPTTLDIAVLAGLACAAGLPLGAALKLVSRNAEEKRPASAPILVASPPPPIRAAEAAPIAAEPMFVHARAPVRLDVAALDAGFRANGQGAWVEAPATVMLEVALPAAMIDSDSTPAPIPPAPVAPPRAKKSAPGQKPEMLPVPRDGGPDDLARIKGIGPKSLEKLYALGVFHYDQIAAWSLDNARWIGVTIGAPGRVERDRWIQQAQALAGAGSGQG